MAIISRTDVKERLQASALALFGKNGFDQTTAAQIAEQAGVTERTFFRYFPDKREVLFANEEMVRISLLEGIARAPATLGSLDTVFHAYNEFRTVIEERRAYAKPRQDLISTTPALQERELSKIAALAGAIAEALEERGVPSMQAKLAATIGMGAIAQAQIDWLNDESIGLAERFEQARNVLKQIA